MASRVRPQPSTQACRLISRGNVESAVAVFIFSFDALFGQREPFFENTVPFRHVPGLKRRTPQVVALYALFQIDLVVSGLSFLKVDSKSDLHSTRSCKDGCGIGGQ